MSVGFSWCGVMLFSVSTSALVQKPEGCQPAWKLRRCLNAGREVQRCDLRTILPSAFSCLTDAIVFICSHGPAADRKSRWISLSDVSLPVELLIRRSQVRILFRHERRELVEVL
jgi:hypothetical protein